LPERYHHREVTLTKGLLLGSKLTKMIKEVNRVSEVDSAKLTMLINDILECIDPIDDRPHSQPIVTMLSDELLILEIDDKRFRISVQDMSRFT
jgi:hypothetical protein